jgi:hypothetical protein
MEREKLVAQKVQYGYRIEKMRWDENQIVWSERRRA